MKPLKILVSGSGISGLSAAMALENKGFPFRIIERKDAFESRGYAMSIQGEGLSAAETLGILDSLKQAGKERIIEEIKICTGKTVTSRRPKRNPAGLTISRRVLHETLSRSIGGIEFGISIKETAWIGNKRHVTFSDGSEDIFDLIIGADGINSFLRDIINRKAVVENSGLSVWNIHVPDYYPKIVEVWNRESIIALYPLNEGLSVSFFSTKAAGESDFISLFKDCMPKEVAYSIDYCAPDIFFGAVRNVHTPVWYKEGILLIGDAAHGVSPLTGMGANLAMTDAVKLAEVLSGVSGGKGIISESNFLPFIQERKKIARKAYRTGIRRQKRALLTPPLSWIRDYRIRNREWEY